MKNQKLYTSNCLRTWKMPNTMPTTDEPSLEEAMAVMAANKYEELAHLIAGLSSEILSELEFAFAIRNQVNIKEEIGDIQYFLLIIAFKYQVSLVDVDENTSTIYSDPKIAKFCMDSPFKAVKFHSGELINLLKKVEIYRDPRKSVEDIREEVIKLQCAIYRLSLKNGFTPEEAIEAVIEKLKVRFAEKFTIEEVSDRDLDSEEKALKG